MNSFYNHPAIGLGNIIAELKIESGTVNKGLQSLAFQGHNSK